MIIRVIDTETTGVDPTVDKIIEVASVDLLTCDDGTLILDGPSMRQTLVNPGRPIPPEASAIHHIVDADVADADDLEAALQEYAGTDIVYVAHNAKFDAAFLPQDWTWACTYKAALRIWPDAPGHSNQVLRYWRGHIEIPLIERQTFQMHRALPDAMTTATILIDLLQSVTIDEMVEWARSPALLPKFRFGKHAGTPLADIPDGYLEWMLRQDFDEDAMHTAKTELERRRS